MANPILPKDFSLFPSFSDIPDPPIEEIVEPKSFRNTLIRTLLWMTIIPVFALFFLLYHQIQATTKDADTVQLSIAQNIASHASNFILGTIEKVQFSSTLMSQNHYSLETLNSVLVNLIEQHEELIYGAWLDKNHHVLASYTAKDKSLNPQLLNLEDSSQIAEKQYRARISQDLRYVSITLEIPYSSGEKIYFLGLLHLSPLITLIKDSDQKQRFSIALLEDNRIIFSSSSTSDQKSLVLTASDWKQIYENPTGCIIRSLGTRNVATVSSFVHIPELNWTVVVSESLQQRDALVRSSTETAMIVLLVTFTASVLVGLLIAGPLSRSVNELNDAVRRFGRTGKFDSSFINNLEKDGTTEIISLGHSFENMARDIQENNNKLENINIELENQVQDRTAKILLRNRELRALHRLLVPIHDINNKNGLDLVHQSIEDFRSIWELKELRFIPILTEINSKDCDQSVTNQRIPVVMNSRLLGWLKVGEKDVLTSDQMESLTRLANSVAILLANKNLVDQLEKEHATLVSVFESMTDGVLIIGRSGRIIYSNDLAAKVLHSSRSIVGKDAYRLIFDHWKPINKVANIDFVVGESIRLVPVDTRNGTKYRTIDIVVFKVSDLPGFSGDRIGLLVRDTTREAEIESMKDNLLSVVAHELKTPVTAMRLQAESLRSYSLEKTVTCPENIDELIEESSRLGQLIDDLLDVSRIEGGAMKLVPKVVQVASLIDRAARLTLSRYPIHIKRTIDPEAETLLADPERLTQVFINLFNNAARYKKETQQVAQCRVHVIPQGNFVRIEIIDDGRGIPDNIIGNIFERFYQANMTDHRVSGGTGLGLSIVRGIVEAHGGKISVESVQGMYTCFIILLPY